MFPARMPSRIMAMDASAGATNTATPPLRTCLKDLCADVANAAAGCASLRGRRVAGALAPYLGMTNLLDDDACQCSSDRYVRHLLHAAADYTILALVWRPRQMSPVHGHRTWCAFGVHKGWMVETLFAPGEDGAVPRTCVQRCVGSVGHSQADPEAVHRLANLGTETAMSIHVYGAPYDRLANEVNYIWAD